MPAKKFSYQYRLVWRYKGEKRNRYYVSDNPGSVLAMLWRVGTDKPYRGVTQTQFRRAWAWYARRLNVSIEAVKAISPLDILTRLQESFPVLDFVRVEQRQVAPWVEMLDPVTNIHLLRPKTITAEEKRHAFWVSVARMTPEELDAWRWLPDEATQKLRTRGDK
jgi:hypothetical protein